MHYAPFIVLSLFSLILVVAIGAAAWDQVNLFQDFFTVLTPPN